MRQLAFNRRLPTPALAPIARSILALLVVSLAFAGCGSSSGGASQNTSGSTPGSEAVSSVMHRYLAAFLADKGSELCSLLTAEGRQLAMQKEYELLGPGPTGNRLGCAEGVEQEREHLSSAEVREIEHASVSVESVFDGTATVVLRAAGKASRVTLSKTPAGWLISKTVSTG